MIFISYGADISQKIPLELFCDAFNIFSYSPSWAQFQILNADDSRDSSFLFIIPDFAIILFRICLSVKLLPSGHRHLLMSVMQVLLMQPCSSGQHAD